MNEMNENEVNEHLATLNVDEMLIWRLDPGDKFDSNHPARDIMRRYAAKTRRAFRTMQEGSTLYVVRVK